MNAVRVEQHRRWTNRHVAREFDHRARRWLWGLVGGIVVATSPLAIWQFEQNECLRLTYEAGELRAAEERLAEDARRLRATAESLRTLAAVEAWALENGWVTPSPEQVVVVVEAKATTELLASNADRRSRGE